MTETITKPHDKFVKETFGDLSYARNFMETYLPSAVTAELNFDTLEISKDSFVGGELSEYYSDVLYRVQLTHRDSSAYVYLLLDHKSYVDAFVPYQLLTYTVQIWEMSLKQQQAIRQDQPRNEKTPLRLPPVIPLVLYHGEDSWTVSREFIDLFDVPDALRPYLPNYQYWLCDLSNYSDEDITGYVGLQVRLLLLKHIFAEDLGQRLPGIFHLLQELESSETALKQLEVLIRYVLSGGKHVTRPQVQQAIEGVFAEGAKITMPTIAEELIQEGREQAEQGTWQLAFKNIRQILAVRFAADLGAYDDQLNQLELSSLKTLNDLAFEVNDLAEFEAELSRLKG